MTLAPDLGFWTAVVEAPHILLRLFIDFC